MLLSQNLVKEALWKASSTGADYAEVFAEYTNSKNISMVSSKVDKIADGVISGVGIRIFKGTRCVSGSTSSLSPEAVLNCAQKVADALIGTREMETIVLRERRFGDIHPIRIVPTTVENAVKIDLMREASETAKNYHSDIAQVTANFLDVDHNIMIATTEGLLAEDRQIRTRMAVSAVASKNGENQTGSCSPGGRMGMEFYEIHNPKEIGEEAARQAMVMINAGYIPAGKMPVAIGNGFGGVIFHEACGHGLEASGVALGQSIFAGKMGEKIANEKGLEELYKKAMEIDSKAMEKISPNDKKRIFRVLEIYHSTGKTKTEQEIESRKNGIKYDCAKIMELKRENEQFLNKNNLQVIDNIDIQESQI